MPAELKTRFNHPAFGRTLMREQACLFLAELVRAGVPRESAIQRTAKSFHFDASLSSVRRWEKAYAIGGFVALLERKIGRVGRKPGRGKR